MSGWLRRSGARGIIPEHPVTVALGNLFNSNGIRRTMLFKEWQAKFVRPIRVILHGWSFSSQPVQEKEFLSPPTHLACAHIRLDPLHVRDRLRLTGRGPDVGVEVIHWQVGEIREGIGDFNAKFFDPAPSLEIS